MTTTVPTTLTCPRCGRLGRISLDARWPTASGAVLESYRIDWEGPENYVDRTVFLDELLDPTTGCGFDPMPVLRRSDLRPTR